MKAGYTHITVILDRTGSMESVKTDTIGGFNHFLKDQKAAPGEATLTLVQFDSQDPYEVLADFAPIAEAKELTDATYVPRADTPLLDAIGRGINDIGAKLAAKAEDQRPEKVLFVILTDGYENASREFTREKVMEMIKRQSETFKWQFVYLGANQDAIAVGASMGIPAQASMSYAHNKVGTEAAFASLSAQSCSYRCGAPDVAFTGADRKRQRDAGAHK